MDYLKSHSEISDVLAEGFAHIYHDKPKFPITYLVEFLRHHSATHKAKEMLVHQIASDCVKFRQLQMLQDQKLRKQEIHVEHEQNEKEREQGFDFRIQQAPNKEDMLNQFCEWIQKQRRLTGVYIGELEHAKKNVDLNKEDEEDATVDSQAPKIIKFKAASHSHNKLMIGKVLSQQSISGRLLNEKPEQGGQAAGGQGQGEDNPGDKQKPSTKGEIYISKVQNSSDITYFKYPRLGSFYAIPLRVKSYLYDKVLDANLIKSETARKAKEEYEKEWEDRQNKFKAMYQERVAAGADEKELIELEKNFQKGEGEIPKPKPEQYEFVLRTFVVSCDTLGLDKQLSAEDQYYIRNKVSLLQTCWQEKQKQILQEDIDRHLKLLAESVELPQQQIFSRLMDEEEKEVLTHQQVEKHKNNEKRFELELQLAKTDKAKEYMVEEKYSGYLDNLLARNVLKNSEIIKSFLYFLGYSKEEVNHKDTNKLHWEKAKKYLSKQIIHERLGHYHPRGCKPELGVKPYALWQRILRNLEKYQQKIVAADNIYLAFILRFLQMCGRARILDSQFRKATAKQAKELRDEKVKEADQKKLQRAQKCETVRADALAKDEPFDQQAWLKTYDQQNPPIDIGQQVPEEINRDLEEINPNETAMQ